MTRSEKLEVAISNARIAIFCQQPSDRDFPAIQEVMQFTLDILLTEQKRNEGCAFCRSKENEHGFFIDGNMLLYEDGKLGTEGIIITTCPRCGRDLTEGESA